MKRLIITADNFGLSKETNQAIQKSINHGIVTSIGVCPSGNGLESAVEWIQETLKKPLRRSVLLPLSVGAHLDFTPFFEVRPNMSSQLWRYRDSRIPLSEMKQVLESQIRLLIENEIPIRFLSSRFHLHLRPELFPIFCKTAKKFHIPIIRFFSAFVDVYKKVDMKWLEYYFKKNELTSIPHFIDGWYWKNIDEKYKVAELACNPSYETGKGEKDLAACCDFRLREYLKWENIELINFDQYLKSLKPVIPGILV